MRITETAIYPKVVKDNDPERYTKTYPELLGTKFEKKSPDFKVGDHFYELKGYITKEPDSGTIGEMLSRGGKQSERVVIMHVPGATDSHYKKRVYNIIGQTNSKITFKEVWIKEGNLLRLIYKKQ